MTKLTAVNRILQKGGEPPALALDTGGTSYEGEAESFLDAELRSALADGYAVGQDLSIEVRPPTDKIAFTGTTGDIFTGDTVTESVSGAVGTVQAIDTSTGYLYIYNAATTAFTGGQTLTTNGGATRTGGVRTAMTATRIIVPDNWLECVSAHDEVFVLSKRNGYLYNVTDETYDFTRTVRVRITQLATFTTLSERLAHFIVAKAALAFWRYKKRSTVDDALLQQELAAAFLKAEQERSDETPINTLQTGEARAILGNRDSDAWSDPDRE